MADEVDKTRSDSDLCCLLGWGNLIKSGLESVEEVSLLG